MKRYGMLLAAAFLALPALGQDAALKVGDKAPAFTAPDDRGESWNSADVIGEKLLVVYFYPAAMTGGCTKQACAFRDHRSTLDELGAEVVGISGDEVDNLVVFRKAHKLNFPLLSDADGRIARAFGVPLRAGGTYKATVDGKEVELKRDVTTARWTFVIDRDGRIVYKNEEVNPTNDTAEVIAAIRKLQS